MKGISSWWGPTADGASQAGRSESTRKIRSLMLAALALTLIATQLQTIPDLDLLSSASDTSAPATTSTADLTRLPLVFEKTVGPVTESARYHARGSGYLFGLGDDGVSMSLEGEEGSSVDLTLAFVGANEAARPTTGERAPGVVNYIMGDDPDAWRTVPTFHEVVYEELWPGIDMVFKGSSGTLKYDFVVAPGADPGDIALAYRGARDLSIVNGALQIETAAGVLQDSRPVSYQRIDGRRTRVPTRFEVAEGGSAGRYGFAVGAYDRSVPLRIDPALVYSTFLGGGGSDVGASIAVDSSGNAYVTGTTSSTNFPTTTGAFQTSDPGSGDAFVTKLNARGTAALYSTYLGGSGEDDGFGIAVSGTGQAVITGTTDSTNFPTTPGAFQTSDPGSTDAFVTKLNASGRAVYSTYLGGSGADGRDTESTSTHAPEIARDGSGNAYVTGSTDSTDFPTTPGAFQTDPAGSIDAFVTKLNPTGTKAVYSTYLGGSGPDAASGIATNSGNAYVTGFTNSNSNLAAADDFPTTPGAFQTSDPSVNSSFVTKFNVSGTELVYSTYLHGGDVFSCHDFDDARAIAVDSSRNAYVTGITESCDFPTTRVFLGADAAESALFVTKFNAAGSDFVWGAQLNGCCSEWGNSIALDGSRNVFVTGGTISPDFPTTPNALQPSGPGGAVDAIMFKLSSSATRLLYSSYLGGSSNDDGLGVAVGGNAHAFVTGGTPSTDFPTTPGAFQTSKSGGFDAFVTRVQP